jgi:hypothetical protein
MDFRGAIAAAIAAAVIVGSMAGVRFAARRFWGRELSARSTFFLTLIALFVVWLVCWLIAMPLDTILKILS